jgi:WD40 repeat protein
VEITLNKLILAVVIRNKVKKIGIPDKQHSYQATAISASGNRVALITLADFTVYDVSTSENKIVCWGDVTQRYAPLPKPAIEQKTAHSYYRAAMTDDVLALASVESFVDLRNAKTGQRINLLNFENAAVCQTVRFSPDGKQLAIALSDGDVLVYQAGLQYDFLEPPICVSHSSRVNSVAFSPDSLLMTVATQDCIVRAYRLSNLSDGYFEQFIEPAVYGRKSKPADIADHALYSPLSVLS